jgi:Flp pilus assembly protein CpaB
VALSGQQEIVIVAVSAQQAEIVKYAQLDGSTTLALRSPKDFVDPKTNQPVVPVPDKTSGITLKVLVDSYGVLPPQVVESVLPAGSRP